MNPRSLYTISQNESFCSELSEKGSRFIACMYYVHNAEEVKQKLQIIKSSYPGARHYCFAWKTGTDENLYRFSDDGEPSGTAGKPIFNQINKHHLTNILIVVVRYFGGILLGTAGLAKAYKAVTNQCIASSSLIKLEQTSTYEVLGDLVSIQILLGILKNLSIGIESINLNAKASVIFTLNSQIEIEYFSKIKSQFEKIPQHQVTAPMELRNCTIKKIEIIP